MRIIIAQDYQELSDRASRIIVGLITEKPDAVWFGDRKHPDRLVSKVD